MTRPFPQTLTHAEAYSVTEGLYRVHVPKQPLTDDEEAEMVRLSNRADELSLVIEAQDGSDAELLAAEEEAEAIIDRIDAMRNKPIDLPGEIKSQIGIAVVILNDGTIGAESTLFSRTPLRIVLDDNGDDSTPPTPVIEENTNNRPTAIAAPVRPEQADASGKALSAKLMDELAVQRRDVLALAMAGDAALCLDFIIFQLAASYVMKMRDTGSAIDIRDRGDPVRRDSFPQCSAYHQLEELYDALDMSWVVGGRSFGSAGVAESFAKFTALDDDAKTAWISYVAARSLTVSTDNQKSVHNPIHDLLAQSLELNPAAYWRPNAANYFDRISKPSILATLGEIGGNEFALRYANQKKSELAISCDRIFSGDAIVDQEILRAAQDWVPAAVRFRDPFAEDAGVIEDVDNVEDIATGDDADGSDDDYNSSTAEGDEVPTPDLETAA